MGGPSVRAVPALGGLVEGQPPDLRADPGPRRRRGQRLHARLRDPRPGPRDADAEQEAPERGLETLQEDNVAAMAGDACPAGGVGSSNPAAHGRRNSPDSSGGGGGGGGGLVTRTNLQ